MSSKLSDTELRRKLLELGFTSGPITDNTRSLYLQKLASLSQDKGTHNLSHASKEQNQSVHSKPKIVARNGPLQQDSKQARPVTPPLDPPPNYSAVFPRDQEKRQPAIPPQSGPASVIVSNLLSTFNDPTRQLNDTAVVFQDGSVLSLSRAVLVAQCQKMAPLLYSNEDLFPVTVATLTGRNSLFLVRPSEFVADLKEKVSLTQAIPTSEQRLVHQNNELPDLATIVSCGIEPGSTIHLVLITTQANPVTVCPLSLLSTVPSVSIGHMRVGLGLENFNQMNSSLVIPTTVLPTHTHHILHVYDTPREGFELFVKWLYTGQLLNEGGVGCLVVCFILSVYFDLPALSRLCLTCITEQLTVTIATELKTYAESIQCEHLKDVCVQFLVNKSQQ